MMDVYFEGFGKWKFSIASIPVNPRIKTESVNL